MSDRPKEPFTRCVADVWEAPGYWHSHQCHSRARSAGRDGAPLCGIHLREDERRAAIGMGSLSRYEETRH